MPKTSAHEPLDPDSPDRVENDRLHAATSIQSPVTPEQYPLKDRELQTAAATDGKTGKRKPEKR